MEHFGSLTLRDPRGLQGAILVEQCGASAPFPSLLTIHIATLYGRDYSVHSYLLLPKRMPCEKWRAKDGEGAPSLQSPPYRVMRFLGRYLSKVADAVIEAHLPSLPGEH
jgi:hypothetical protein